jgi:hypothetical protein
MITDPSISKVGSLPIRRSDGCESRLTPKESNELRAGPGGNDNASDWRHHGEKCRELGIMAGDVVLKLASLHTKGLTNGGLSDPLDA